MVSGSVGTTLMEDVAIESGVARVTVVIPTYNAARHWDDLCKSLRIAGVSPRNVLIIDSSSLDKTQELALANGFRVISIPQSEFNHGGTRKLACEHVPEGDAVIMMTQDAVITDPEAISRLWSALDDPRVGAAYGRQLGRPNGDAIELHSRWFNYPPTSRMHTMDDKVTMGIKAAFLSNSFSIYRRAALDKVGGFPERVILSEDSYVAAKMLGDGWTIAYVADAAVVHSHHFTVREEFGRYFDIGVHHARESWLLETFGSALGEGKRFVRSELRYLLQNAPHLIPLASLRTVSKLFAYRLGKRWQRLPRPLVRRLSSCTFFWND